MEVPSANFKQLSAALTLMSRVGKDVIIEIEPSQLTLKALSDAKSSFASITFKRPFFSTFDSRPALLRTSQGSQNERRDSGTFKVSAKVLCSICKSSAGKGLSHVLMRPAMAGVVHELVIELYSLSGVKRVHHAAAQDAESIAASFHIEPNNSVLVASPATFNQVINHIGSSNELLIEASSNVFNIKTFFSNSLGDGNITSTKDFLEFIKQPNMYSGASLNVFDFESYIFNQGREDDHVDEGSGANLVLPMRELKAFLGFTEAMNVPEFEMMFSEGGNPVRLCCQVSNTIEVVLVLATLQPQLQPHQQQQQQQQQQVEREVEREETYSSNGNNRQQSSIRRKSNGHRAEDNVERHGQDLGEEEELLDTRPKRREYEQFNEDNRDEIELPAEVPRYNRMGGGGLLRRDSPRTSQENGMELPVGNRGELRGSQGSEYGGAHVGAGGRSGIFDNIPSQKVDFSNLINAIVASPGGITASRDGNEDEEGAVWPPAKRRAHEKVIDSQSTQ